MNSKKAITLLVLATLLLSMVPMAFAAFTMDPLVVDEGVYGDTIVVEGSGVLPGTVVELFWDDATIPWNGVKGKLNVTTAAGAGTFEIWFDVPEAINGPHYVTVKSGGDFASATFTVNADVDLASSSGLSGDKIDADAFGQAGDKDLAMVMVSTMGIANWNWVPVAPAAVTWVAAETEYDGDLVGIVQPGTVSILEAAENFVDNGDGTLTGSVTGTGKINYVTGEWEIEYAAAPVAAPITIAYSMFTEAPNTDYELTSGETNGVGSYTKKVTIPVAAFGDYYVETLDAKGNSGSGDFTIGAVITASPKEAAVGDLITISGRGFNPLDKITYGDGVTVGGLLAVIDDYGTGVAIDLDGKFSLKLVVPQMDDEDDYDVSVSEGVNSPTVEIEVTELASITVTPEYGPQGQTISVEGKNFPNIKDEDLAIELNIGGAWIKDFETNSDGTFSGTFRIPAVLDDTYEINAYWNDPTGRARTIQAQDDLRVGSILVLLTDNEGPAGLKVTISGNGFTAGEGWNATFGDIDIFEDMTVGVNGLLGANPSFYVPQVEPGTYDIRVLDEDTGIPIVVEFTVTDTTSFEIDPVDAPAGYNITFNGMYWSEEQTTGLTFDFWVFNDTKEWDITTQVNKVMNDGSGGKTPFMTGDADGSDADDGAFTAWWYIGAQNPEDAKDIFDKGTYTINVTYGDDWFYQTTFDVGDEHVGISPRKSVFRIGDTLSFDIEHSFGNNAGAPIAGGTVDVFDPSGDLYFRTNSLGAGIWIQSGMYFYVPVPQQTANFNPMVLLDDAPLGEWSYEWYESGADPDLIAEGTFMVESSNEDIVSGKIDDLNTQITNLQDTVSGVSSEFDTVRSDIADVAAIAQQAVTAANSAADAIQTVAQTANTASQAAQDAADAANAAKDAASGLTTLVYGAIGASLVAALAAIVSLMQISRRIAG